MYLRFTIWLIVIMAMTTMITGKFEFTNVKCFTFDKKHVELEFCYLKSINRTYKYCSAKMRLNTIPLTNMVVNLALLKRLNGYKPFLYNITYEACKLLSNPKTNPVANFFYEFIQPFSNVNHLCPYNNDLILEKLPVDHVDNRLTNILPFPEGDYLVNTTFSVKGIKSGLIQIYGTLS